MARAVHQFVAESARRDGAAPAVTFRSTTLTYVQLWELVEATASGLRGRGIRRGDRVAVYLDKRIETVVALLGISAAGAVFVPVNPVLKPRQVAYILADCGVRGMVTTADRLSSLVPELPEGAGLTDVVIVGHLPAELAEGCQHLRLHSWGDFVSVAGHTPTHDPVDLDVAAILYTSGSTGMPKGVVLSHRNLVVGAESVSEYLENTPDDVILAVLPLSFDAGLSQLNTAFHVGAHVVLVNYLLPQDVVRLCALHRVTGLTCVPPLWIQLMGASWTPEATASLRYFANTGGRMPKSTLGRLRETFPKARPFLMYGLTEAFRSTYLDPEQVEVRPDSIGKAIPNAEILVVHPDGTLCEDDEPGELVHRGPLVAMGYWNDPERTAERFKPVPGQPNEVPQTELAVWSGDAVRRDREGYLYFVGRQDDMIKTSGYRVSPTEVEEAAYDTGLVQDAVALGVEDEVLGQEVVLLATMRDSATPPEVLMSALRARLPLFMAPRRLVLMGELPRSPNGKFDRTALREVATA